MQKKKRARHKTYVPTYSTYTTQSSRFRLFKPFNPGPEPKAWARRLVSSNPSGATRCDHARSVRGVLYCTVLYNCGGAWCFPMGFGWLAGPSAIKQASCSASMCFLVS